MFLKGLASEVSLALGVAGGALGLLVSQSPSFGRQDFAALSCGCEAIYMLRVALPPAAVGAAIGIIGGALSFFRETEGGILLLAGAGLSALGWLFAMGEIASSGSFLADEIALGYVFIDFFWWNTIILLAGLVAFPTTRGTLKRLRQEGWLP